MGSWRRNPASLVVVLLIAGCATAPSSQPLPQWLDRNTGATVTTLPEPLSFFHSRPMLAANARDYVYAGPVEVNRTGERTYLLWVAYCSTIDRIGIPVDRVPASGYLVLDGVPMDLIHARQAPEMARPVYEPAVAGGEFVMYRLTRAQLLAIADASEISFLAQFGDGEVTEFLPWRPAKSDFRRFSRHLAGEAAAGMASARE